MGLSRNLKAFTQNLAGCRVAYKTGKNYFEETSISLKI